MKPLTTVCGVLAALAVVVATLGRESRGSGPPAGAPVESDLQEKRDVYVRHLNHGSVEQRGEAVLALGRIEQRTKTAIPALRAALKCEDTRLRVEVAEVLWHANKDPAAIAVKAALLKDKDCNAVEPLARIGPGAKAAVPALLEALDKSWKWEPMRVAWETLPSRSSSGCRPCETPPPPGLRPGQAAWLLWRIEKHPAAMPALIKSRAYG